ncbi:MAG: 1-acyl-sn-glycerol-3-phosphate acyltransferase [Clostridia bacterium]|nr:1-acyl-sn-glycerol-3-phosphate acyltransferase [Clostridia bacterium]
MITFWNTFVKITGWLTEVICFRPRVFYEDKQIQSKRIKGPAIIISNHTSVLDYVAILFVFFFRTVRAQMAEVLFEKKGLRILLKWLGGIRVDRKAHDYGFVEKSKKILEKGGVVLVFPESRLPLPGEARPLPFVPSVAYLALSSGVPVIPVYTNGSYFKKKRLSVLIGKPIDTLAYLDTSLSEKEQLARISEKYRERIMELGDLLEEYEAKKAKK